MESRKASMEIQEVAKMISETKKAETTETEEPEDIIDNASIEDRLFTVKYTDSGEPHIEVAIEGVCEERCDTYECISVCPAEVWKKDEDEEVPTVAYENCLECGSCRIACPYNNVKWEYPENGAGVTFKYG